MYKQPDSKSGRKRLKADQRRALQLLASSPRGGTEAVLLAHGFRRELLAQLAFVGLATVASETMRAGTSTITVERYRITAAGREAIED
jgi:hypothetical protein